MMYNYSFSATFVCGLPAIATITTAIKSSLQRFNSINRKHYKHLTVTIGNNGELLYKLESNVPIDSKNLLRCTQQFSKELSKEELMNTYIVPNRLLKR